MPKKKKKDRVPVKTTGKKPEGNALVKRGETRPKPVTKKGVVVDKKKRENLPVKKKEKKPDIETTGKKVGGDSKKTLPAKRDVKKGVPPKISKKTPRSVTKRLARLGIAGAALAGGSLLIEKLVRKGLSKKEAETLAAQVQRSEKKAEKKPGKETKKRPPMRARKIKPRVKKKAPRPSKRKVQRRGLPSKLQDRLDAAKESSLKRGPRSPVHVEDKKGGVLYEFRQGKMKKFKKGDYSIEKESYFPGDKRVKIRTGKGVGRPVDTSGPSWDEVIEGKKTKRRRR